MRERPCQQLLVAVRKTKEPSVERVQKRAEQGSQDPNGDASQILQRERHGSRDIAHQGERPTGHPTRTRAPPS